MYSRKGEKNKTADNFFEKISVATRVNLGVIGAGNGVGTSTLSLMFAYYYAKKLKKKVSFTQLTKEPGRDNLVFVSLGFDKKFEDEFEDIYKQVLLGDSLVSVGNFYDGINFRLADSRLSRWSEDEVLKLNESLDLARVIASARGDVNVFDIDYSLRKESWMLDFDALIVVVDPLPSVLEKYQQDLRYYMNLENKGVPVIWIINKMNKGVPKNQISKLFKGRKTLFFSDISVEIIYNYQYKCQSIYKDKTVMTNFDDLFTKNSHDIT